MKTTRIISGLALLFTLMVSSCCKMEPLQEKGTHCEESTQVIEKSAIMIQGDTYDDTNGITDPDHDEDHDKDDLKGH